MRKSKFIPVIAVLTVISMMAWADVATAEGNRLRANLTGEKEVDSEGDPDGSGTARIRLRPRARRVCWNLTWQNITQPQAAHIHRGDKTETGPVVVNLFVEPQEGNEASGCENNVPRRLIRRIRNRPGNFYVNVHTQDYPAGAIRGQLHR